MILALQALPLLLLIGLLFSGRVAALPAVLAALVAAIPAAFVSLPDNIALPGFLGEQMLRGAYLALQPMGVVLAGLLFYAAVSGAAGTQDQAPATARRVFIATLLLGTFMESVTGFAVGAVFALATLRGMGIIGAPAGAMALLALCLIPWGGLGPGSLLGAALIGLPAQDLMRITALPNALWLLLLGPVLWRLCAAAGLAVPAAEKLAQMGYLLAVALLLGRRWPALDLTPFSRWHFWRHGRYRTRRHGGLLRICRPFPSLMFPWCWAWSRYCCWRDGPVPWPWRKGRSSAAYGRR